MILAHMMLKTSASSSFVCYNRLNYALAYTELQYKGYFSQ